MKNVLENLKTYQINLPQVTSKINKNVIDNKKSDEPLPPSAFNLNKPPLIEKNPMIQNVTIKNMEPQTTVVPPLKFEKIEILPSLLNFNNYLEKQTISKEPLPCTFDIVVPIDNYEVLKENMMLSKSVLDDVLEKNVKKKLLQQDILQLDFLHGVKLNLRRKQRICLLRQLKTFCKEIINSQDRNLYKQSFQKEITKQMLLMEQPLKDIEDQQVKIIQTLKSKILSLHLDDFLEKLNLLYNSELSSLLFFF